MALSQRSGRNRHRLVLLVLTAVTLLTLDFRDFGPLDTVQRGVRNVLEPVTSVVSTVVSPIGDAWGGLFGYGDLEDENEQLRMENDELRGDQVANEADLAAFAQLREAVDIDYIDDVESVAATVIRGGVGNFEDHVITIDKGSRDGLEEDMAVVTGAGLVGRLERVDATVSTVHLLSDPALTVGVRLVGVDETGLAHSQAGTDGVLLVDRGLRWPEDDDPAGIPEIGSAVVTSALSLYPANIPVGTVASVDTVDDLTMMVAVTLLNDLDDLSYVSVLLARGVDEIPLEPVVPPGAAPAEDEEGEDGSTDDTTTDGVPAEGTDPETESEEGAG